MIEEVPQNGYLYIWLSNETAGSKVWFDDLRIQRTHNQVSEETDYYPFGHILSQWKYDSKKSYRFGYQGEFAEEDEETVWNQFEERMYDPVIGRWISIDKRRQHFSPYLAMSNNPILFVDADGLTDWPALGWALLNVTGGALEVVGGAALSVGTGGLASVVGVAGIVDGSSRVVLGFHNALMAAVSEGGTNDYENRRVGSNLLGVAGQIIDASTDREDHMFRDNGEMINDVISLANPMSMPSNAAKLLQISERSVNYIAKADNVMFGFDLINTSSTGLNYFGIDTGKWLDQELLELQCMECEGTWLPEIIVEDTALDN